MRQAILLATVFFLVCASLTSPAQEEAASTNKPAAGRTISLVEAKNTAFERNWDLLAAKSGVDAATAQLLVSREFPNPTLALSTAKIGSHDSATELGNGLWHRSYDSIAAVSQLIEIGGKRRDRRVAAQAGVAGAKARFFDARRTLDQGVTKAYIAALLAAENARVLGESATYMRQEAGIAEERFKAGDLADADKGAIEINAEQFELQAKSAEAAAAQARVAVELLMGVPQPKGDWKPADSLEKLMEAGLMAETNSAANRGATRPDVLAAEADLRGGLAQLKLQKAMRIPDPTVTLGGEHEPPGGGPPTDTFLIGVSFPLPLWNWNTGNIHAAKAAVDQFEEALGKARTQAAADIATAESAFGEARQRWLRYRDVTAPKSAKVRETVVFKYDKGAATLVDLLNAAQTDNTVRLALAQAMNDAASAAADLAAATSSLSESEMNSLK